MALPPHTLPVGNPSQVMGLRRSLAVSWAKTHLSFIFFCVTFVFWYSMAWRSVNQCAWKVQNFLQSMNRFLRQWCWGCVSVAYVFSKSLSKLGGKNLMVSWGVKAFILLEQFSSVVITICSGVWPGRRLAYCIFKQGNEKNILHLILCFLTWSQPLTIEAIGKQKVQ